MNVEELLKKKYSKFASANIGDELLFRHDIALQIIEDCKKLNSIIAKMVFWQRKDDEAIEVNSTNYSAIDTGKNSSKDTIEAASKLIENKLPDDAEYVSFFLEDNVSF